MIVSNPNPSGCQAIALERLLHDELDEAQAAAFAEHLERCPECQQALDDTMELDGAWHRARSTVIERLGIETLRRAAAREGSHDSRNQHALGEVFLGWLKPYQPSEADSQYLGILDGYPIVRVLGTGGMGIVLEGWDRDLHRPVAIKVMHMHLAAIGVAKQRFVREARCAASIVHPNVVAIHRIHAEHMPPYFVMPLVAGESLQERLHRQGTLPVDQALRIVAQVADGLSAAEKQGLIHRDVKPANILVEMGTDRAVLTDFGLVRALDEATITHSGSIAGTPQYMSPEQAAGESLDARTDLYSLGAVLYAMLTGHPPFTDRSPLALVKKIAESQPKPVTHYDPTVPASVVVFLEWLMHKDRRQRPAHAADVARLATEIHANLINPMQYGLPSRIRGLIGRERWKAWKWPAMAGLVALVAINMVWWLPRDGQRVPSQNTARATSGDENRTASSDPDGQALPSPARSVLPADAVGVDPDLELQSLDEQLLQLERTLYEEMRSISREAIEPSNSTDEKEPLK
ncbi:MAG: protein kinase domain-containing protein [Pirellula sp.]